MADIFTTITASGSDKELSAMLQVLHKYSFDAKERYNVNRDCWYLDTKAFDALSQEKIAEWIATGKISVSIDGPYGAVCDPYSDYNVLFTDLADAAPMARFDVRIEGFVVGGKIFSTAALREGKLYFSTDYYDHGSAEDAKQPADQSGGKILGNEKEVNILSGLTFVITGDLKKFKNRDAITIFIEERAGTVGSGVTKKTNFLISNAKKAKTAKNNKAKELGIPVVTEAEFLEQFGLEYQPHKSKEVKMYEAGYYDPILRVFQPPRKLKKEPLTLQVIFECIDQNRHVLQIDLDVSDNMRLLCTPDEILACKDLEEMEHLFVDSIADSWGTANSQSESKEKRRVDEFQKLFMKKWLPIKEAIKSVDTVERIIIKRTDVRRRVRLIYWADLFHDQLQQLAKAAAISKADQKEENIAAFERYLDEQKMWFPNGGTPQWPSYLCGYDERADLNWRALTDDPELFAKLIVTEEMAELDHGEETTVVNFKTKEYQQSASYFPGW